MEIYVHFIHAVQFYAFPLEPSFQESCGLVLQVRVGVDTGQRASSRIEVLHHHLSKTIVRVEHLIVKYPAQSISVFDVLEQLINWLRLNVAEHTFAVEKGGHLGVELILSQYCLEFCNIG